MEPLAKNLTNYAKCNNCGAKVVREFKSFNRKNYVNGMYSEEKLFECGFNVAWNRLLGVRVLKECKE